MEPKERIAQLEALLARVRLRSAEPRSASAMQNGSATAGTRGAGDARKEEEEVPSVRELSWLPSKPDGVTWTEEPASRNDTAESSGVAPTTLPPAGLYVPLPKTEPPPLPRVDAYAAGSSVPPADATRPELPPLELDDTSPVPLAAPPAPMRPRLDSAIDTIGPEAPSVTLQESNLDEFEIGEVMEVDADTDDDAVRPSLIPGAVWPVIPPTPSSASVLEDDPGILVPADQSQSRLVAASRVPDGVSRDVERSEAPSDPFGLTPPGTPRRHAEPAAPERGREVDDVAEHEGFGETKPSEKPPPSSRRPIALEQQMSELVLNEERNPPPLVTPPPESGKQESLPEHDFEGDLTGIREASKLASRGDEPLIEDAHIEVQPPRRTQPAPLPSDMEMDLPAGRAPGEFSGFDQATDTGEESYDPRDKRASDVHAAAVPVPAEPPRQAGLEIVLADPSKGAPEPVWIGEAPELKPAMFGELLDATLAL